MSKSTARITKSELDKPVVVHIINGLRFGGNETLCLQLLRHASPQVQNILLNVDPEHQEMLPLFQKISGLAIHHQATPLHPRHYFVWDLHNRLKQWQPQAVLVYSFGLHLFVGLAARLAGVSVIAVHAGTPHANAGHKDRWKWKVLIGFSRLINIPVYSCSHTTHQALTTLMRLPVNSFAIPNGCDVTGIADRANLSRSHHLQSNATIIGMVARLNTIKDQATLIRAFKLLLQIEDNVELWLVGEGSEQAALESLCKDLSLQGKVKFWGSRADVPELLGQMNIYAFSTTQDEGFGIALIEAMAASLPIVASRVSACREVLNEGEAGILVSPQDADAMAKVLATLVRFPQERKTWGQRAYDRAAKHYSIQTCAQQWYDLLLNRGERI